MEKGFKKCPFCANEIKEKAIKCQYCGEFLDKKGSIISEDEKSDKQLDVKESVKVFDESKIKKTDEKNLTSEEKAFKKSIGRINTAFWIQCICFIGSLIAFISSFSGASSFIFGDSGGSVSIFDLIYSGILAFFIFKRNRMAALFSFLYYVVSSFYLLVTYPVFQKSFTVRFLIVIGLFMGVIGSFKYHALTNQRKLSTSEIVLLVVGIIITSFFVLGIVFLFSNG